MHPALTILTTLALALVTTPAHGQAEVQQWFEAGRYQQVVDTAGPEAPPQVLFMAALSAQKLSQGDRTRALLSRLLERPANDPWHAIGQSAIHLLDQQGAPATAEARRAAASDLPEAHYQLGLALAFGESWSEAAAAFDRASALGPSMAYAYYYAGLMHYRAKRPDLMAIRFEQFLKLAPEAPERVEVLQIMRTIRGR